jgi:hypothetical protein
VAEVTGTATMFAYAITILLIAPAYAPVDR